MFKDSSVIFCLVKNLYTVFIYTRIVYTSLAVRRDLFSKYIKTFIAFHPYVYSDCNVK